MMECNIMFHDFVEEILNRLLGQIEWETIGQACINRLNVLAIIWIINIVPYNFD